MNNSEALRDDNGKLEVRLCVAGVCGRLADSFQPGGNRKRLFIHIIYVNKMTLLFKVSERGRVTTNLVVVERQSDDYGSAVTSIVSPNAITSIAQSCPGRKKRGPSVGGWVRIKPGVWNVWPVGQMWLFVSVCVATTSLYLSNYVGNYCRWCRFSRRLLQLLLPNFSAHVSLLQGFQKDEQILTFPFASSGVSKCVKRQSSLGIFTSAFQHIQMREKMLNDSKF